LRNYEIITIFQDGQDIQASKKSFQEVLERNAVKVASEEDWGVRRLPHFLKRQSSGYYHYCSCQMDPSRVKDVNHDMLILQDILHHMITSLN